jgi:DNA mismatch repair protein MutL
MIFLLFISTLSLHFHFFLTTKRKKNKQKKEYYCILHSIKKIIFITRKMDIAMQKIYFLDPQEAQKIAAGEVIERPMGVVKECVENSIDALATSIVIQIENSGKDLIKISDDGLGMNADDLGRSIAPFATSKIKKLDDLESLNSFGFRGEALASIASISKLTLRSKERSEDTKTLGNQISLHAGKFIEQKTVSMSAGTEISIEDLFYNTPVRKKFLRAPETEWNGIVSTVHAFCLSHLQINFTLIKDGKEVLYAPAVNRLEERIGQIWGVDLAEKMIPVAYTDPKEDITILGAISNQHVYRYNRQQIIYFINNRLVKNSSMSKAVVKGYRLSLPEGRFPIAVLTLQMNGSSIDVNIHPRKEEVRFIKPGVVDTALSNAVQKALEEHNSKSLALTQKSILHKTENQTPPSTLHRTSLHDFTVDPFKKMYQEQPLTNLFKQDTVITFATPTPHVPLEPTTPKATPLFIADKPVSNSLFAPVKQAPLEEKVEQSPQKPSLAFDELFVPQIIGSLYQTYILLESEEGLLCVDQHAAHERILYEKWKKNFEKKEGSQLLFPHTFSLPEHERSFILSLHSFFADQGFEIEPFGKTNLIIQTAPPQINGVDIVECIKEIAGKFVDQQTLSDADLRIALNEHMHSHLACKAAVKAGDQLSPEAQKQLIKDLFVTPNRHQCIHGRPTIWLIKKTEIAKAFKRPTE